LNGREDFSELKGGYCMQVRLIEENIEDLLTDKSMDFMESMVGRRWPNQRGANNGGSQKPCDTDIMGNGERDGL
jgi:hypothetical protein